MPYGLARSDEKATCFGFLRGRGVAVCWNFAFASPFSSFSFPIVRQEEAIVCMYATECFQPTEAGGGFNPAQPTHPKGRVHVTR